MGVQTRKLQIHKGRTNSGGTLIAYIQFKETTDENALTTTVHDIEFYISLSSSSGGHSIGPWSSGKESWVSINGKKTSFDANIPKKLGEGTHRLAKISGSYKFNNDPNNGKLTYTVEAQWTARTSWGNVDNPTSTAKFSNQMEVSPKITDFPTSFKIGTEPTITFTRPKRLIGKPIEVCIAVKDDDGNWKAETSYGGTEYQEAGVTSYTFSSDLTKNILTNFPKSSFQRNVRFYLKWSENGVNKNLSKDSIAILDREQISGYNYTIDLKDVKIKATNDNQLIYTETADEKEDKYILNAGKINITIPKATGLFGAVIKSYEVLQGEQVLKTSNNNIITEVPITSNKLSVRFVDSRGIYSKEAKITLNTINYTPLTMEVALGGYMDETTDSTSTEGEINQVETKKLLVSVSGECFWGKFSDNNHSAIELTTSYIDADKNKQIIKKIIVKENPTSQQEQNSVNTGENDEQIPEIEGEEGVYISGAEYIISEDEKGFYNFTFVLNNLISTQENSINCTAAMVYSNNTTNRVPDEITALETISNSQVAKEEIPVYDYNEESFRFNVPVEFFGGSKLLWKCSQAVKGWYMNDKQQITIPNFQDMPNGIVLVFSQFDPDKVREDGGTGEAVEWNFQSFFISKHTIEVLNGRMQCFLLTTHNLTRLGTKGLKFTKTTDGKGVTITGRADNGAVYGGSTGGLKSENTSFVLRYIYGT